MYRLIAFAAVVLSVATIAVGSPVYNDLWDVSQGAVVSPGDCDFDLPELAFGGSVTGGDEFAAGLEGLFTWKLRWYTPNPIVLSAFVINVVPNPAGPAASFFELKAGSSPGLCDLLSMGTNIDYDHLEETHWLALPVTAQYFEAHFTLLSGETSPPRVVELDAVAVPEPAALSLLALGVLALIRRRHK